jgi:antitoxin (DNA-binding transcriptional repressor) of toxin-antitoxin stability system
MKTINVRELRSVMPLLKETLAKEHELLLVSNGEPVARILPVLRKRQVPSLAAHRAKMAMVSVPTEVLLREERDRR